MLVGQQGSESSQDKDPVIREIDRESRVMNVSPWSTPQSNDWGMLLKKRPEAKERNY